MTNDIHTKGGNPPWKLSRRVILYGGITGTLSGRLRHGWRPVTAKPRIENKTPYAKDFYLGHPRRLVRVPAHVRKTKHGPVKVKAHYRWEPAQEARPLNWTRPWIDTALGVIRDFYEEMR